MTRSFTITSAIILIASSVLAAPVKGEKTDLVRGLLESTGTFAGKIIYIATAGTVGEKTEMVVEDAKGKKLIFPLDQAVEVTGAAANLITLGELKSGEAVSVQYKTTEYGTKKATKIKVRK